MTMINTVCLCGSTRFAAEFDEANRELTVRGLSVLTISMVLSRDAKADTAEGGLKELLDLVHLNKILRADAVLVVGDGYIGRSTAREVLWSEMQGKPAIPVAAVPGRPANWDAIAHNLRINHGSSRGLIDRARAVLRLTP